MNHGGFNKEIFIKTTSTVDKITLHQSLFKKKLSHLSHRIRLKLKQNRATMIVATVSTKD